MANTNALKKITEYVIINLSEPLCKKLKPGKVLAGTKGKLKEFDGVSDDCSIVVEVINHGGYTSGGKLPTAKIKNTFSDCYFLSLTKAEKKILAFTNKEFYLIFKEKSDGYIEDIELRYVELPDEYRKIADSVLNSASDEMTRQL